ncbi:CbtA family protein [Haloterrigena alkaliphila]|uniref:CbtA family protein n=1 Tax=Haloterrigena alkaliphila TaxID=2816475 RepID=UPI001CFF826C|nr:CbtA family protein [Haloterrigena alkaliphila]UHQ95396.1 CbtA family protein [Haloterrigena alkaliphila]
MLRAYLERGILAGAIAGIAYGLYVALVANPLVAYVEGVGHDGGGHGHEAGHAHEHAHEAGEHAHAVTETTTALVSVGSGVLWGILLGGLFAVAFYLLEPALPGPRAIQAAVLAGAGYLTVSVAPWLVLPPAAPGAEQSLDPEPRLAIYAGMMVVGALVAAASVFGYDRTATRNRLVAVAVGAAPIVALVIVVPAAAPTITSHAGLPADLVLAYQGLAVLSQAALWLLVAGSFSWLLGYVEAGTDATRLEDELVADS